MMKKKKIRPFAKRLTRRIAIAQLLVMMLASYFIYTMTKNLLTMEEADLYKSYLRTANGNVERTLTDVASAAFNRVDEIVENLDKPDKMTSIMEKVVAKNPNIRSCGVSFVADYYPQKGHWFCPYASRQEDGKIKKQIIGNARRDYLKSEWFTEALKADSCYWSKPFFDGTDSITPLVSYLIPIHDKQGKIVAILGADLALKEFTHHLMIMGQGSKGDSINIQIGTSRKNIQGNGFNGWDRKWRVMTKYYIIDSDGTFIAHDNSDCVVRDNYFEKAKETSDSIDDQIGRRMVAREKGSYLDSDGSYKSFEFFDEELWSVYMFFEPVNNTDWSIAVTVPRLMLELFGIIIGISLLLLIGLAMLVTRIVGRIIIKHATKPLKHLANSANEVAKGNFKTTLPPIKHNDEIRLLRDSFEEMQRSLTDYIEELKDTTASKAAIENELKVAHDIQMSMIPKIFPPYPERDDIDIFGSLSPAKDVGGDLFDFYIRDEKLFFCIGDVSGKGVPASLFMAMTRSLFRNISGYAMSPDHIVTALNAAMTEGNEANMFVTLFIGVLHLDTGLLQYCNAGHDEPLLIGEQVTTLSCDPNLPVGIMPDFQFSLQQTTIAPQTTIFLFTDGLNEAENITHAQFGNARIVNVAESMAAQAVDDPSVIVSKMSEAVHDFVGEAEQSDDLTMLAIKFH